jgi:hypothetical protein
VKFLRQEGGGRGRGEERERGRERERRERQGERERERIGSRGFGGQEVLRSVYTRPAGVQDKQVCSSKSKPKGLRSRAVVGV